jgi:hypothetical protein
MTIAVVLKVHDGLVLAADSASSMVGPDAGGVQAVYNVYNNANKIINLYKGLPIGGITWGAGSIGFASISTLAKDLRARLSDRSNKQWAISPDSYTIEEVAIAARRFLFEETYQPVHVNTPEPPSLGFIVAGYSAGADLAEEWEISIENGNCGSPSLIRQRADTGLAWRGQGEMIFRIVHGVGTGLETALVDLGVGQPQAGQAAQAIRAKLELYLVHSAMPIQDAIDLARFLAEAAVMGSRFASGANVVGGAIDIAAITKHEGFKWIQRKFYYDERYNPEEEKWWESNSTSRSSARPRAQRAPRR